MAAASIAVEKILVSSVSRVESVSLFQLLLFL